MKSRSNPLAIVLVIVVVLSLFFGKLTIDTVVTQQNERFDNLTDTVQALYNENESLRADIEDSNIRLDEFKKTHKTQITGIYTSIDRINVKFADIPEFDVKSALNGIYKDIEYLYKRLN